jgi:hypothetical protein
MTATLIELNPGQALADIVNRGEDAAAIQDQARHVDGCAHPIRLSGRINTIDRLTGELKQAWSSESLPDGVTHTRCNNRRASRSEPCSRLYQQDAWQLIVPGLACGKGVPDTVAAHPTVFVTLTAPSFGAVHTRVVNDGGEVTPCRVRRDETDQLCEHGQPVTCTAPSCAPPEPSGPHGNGPSADSTPGKPCAAPPKEHWSDAGRSLGSAGGWKETRCSPTPSDNKHKRHAKPPEKHEPS